MGEPKAEKKGKDKAKITSEGKTKSTLKKVELDGDVNEAALLKELRKMDAVTRYSIASKLDLKMSTAKRLLRKLNEKGVLESVGGNTRVRIYKLKG